MGQYRPVNHPQTKELDELELAKRLVLGESQRQAAASMDLSQGVVQRRVRRWRRQIIERTGNKPANVVHWQEQASVVVVARRWLYLSTGDERWAPLDIEKY